MELAKELIAEVLRDRTKADTAKCGPALASAERLLSEGAAVSVHLMMGHADCKASAVEFCDSLQTLEVWTFRLQREVPYEMSAVPPMLPLFLRQAVRSQLHFSPFRSWLTARQFAGPSDDFCPLLRVSSDFAAPSIPSVRFQSHHFPPCLVRSLPVIGAPLRITPHHRGSELWLRVDVQWLKKECFPTEAPLCPETSMEQQDGLWLFASMGRCRNRMSNTAPEQRTGQKDNSDSMSGAESNESHCQTPSESLIAPRKTIDSKEGARKDSTKNREEKRAMEGTHGNTKVAGGIVLEKRSTKMTIAEGVKSGVRGERTTGQQNDAEREADDGASLGSPHRPKMPNQTQNSNPTTASFTKCALFRSKMPILRPIKRNGPSLNELRLADRIREERKCTPRLHISHISMETPNFPNNKKPWRTPSRLICNFEESILNGRIPANSVVSGFRLQLTVISNGVNNRTSYPASKRLTLPVLTYFFNDLMSQISERIPAAVPPSPLHLARCEFGAETIPIPKWCTLQIVLLRPCGSVVKLFIVEVNVLDMPPNSKTFIRQRIFSGDSTKETGEKKTDRMGENEHKMDGPAVPNATPCPNSLRFLIHLRLASDCSGKVYLHGGIRILFSNRSNDLEGLESVDEKSMDSACSSFGFDNKSMRTMAQMPQTPKYSPV